jgi:hypothetical protein
MKSILFRLRHRIALWLYERKHGKFGPAPF